MAISAPCQQARHSVRHIGFFYQLLTARIIVKRFSFFIDDISNEINFGTKMGIDPKCKDQKCIFACIFFNFFIILFFFLATVRIGVRVNGLNGVGLDKWVKPMEDDVIYDIMALKGACQRLARECA